MNNLIGFLLKLVEEPELAAQFRDDPAAVLEMFDLSEDERAELEKRLSPSAYETEAASSKKLKKGGFYVGNDNNSHIYAVYTAKQDVLLSSSTLADSVDGKKLKDSRIEVDTPGEEDWEHPKHIMLMPKYNRKVYLDHMRGATARLTGKITSLTIEVDEPSVGDTNDDAM